MSTSFPDVLKINVWTLDSSVVIITFDQSVKFLLMVKINVRHRLQRDQGDGQENGSQQ